ncbi:Hydra magnipapillata [Nesidiocoris tenuis]|uniref:Hydra magnipapillata n=1 Tax=Nesidiocoris tenuis TaxID=355587 RepID=A0ABN7B5R4_9HEMI|nr:Hydra magnipapillata [Nesidiocoris tenuis]
MADSGSGIPNFEKLKGRINYKDWKFVMTNYLRHENLWDSVAGYADDDKTTAEVKSRRDMKALCKINLMVEKNIFPYVSSAKTAMEAWTALERAFEDRGLNRRVSLLRRLFSLKLVSFRKMEDYINEVMDLAQQLASMDKPIEDEFIGVILLQGLPPVFDPMVMALESSNTIISSDFVKNKLLQDDKWNTGQLRTSQENTALYSSPSKDSRSKGKLKKLRCWVCDKDTHLRSDCPEREKHRLSQRDSKGKKVGKHSPSSSALFSAFGAMQRREVADWIIDSAANRHMTGNKSLLREYSDIDTINRTAICVANGETLFSAGQGCVSISVENPNISLISDVVFVPGLCANLLSVGALTNKGFTVRFESDMCIISEGEIVVATGTNRHGIYSLDLRESDLVDNDASSCALISEFKRSETLWHLRTAHLNVVDMRLLRDHLATGIEFTNGDLRQCESCISGKSSKLPFALRKDKELAKEKLALVHSDVCGPMQVESYSGCRYFVTFIDDCSRKVFIYFIEKKGDVLNKFKEFKSLVENETERKIKTLRSDRGGEYLSHEFCEFLKIHGIRHELSAPHVAAQNGFSERTNRSIMDKVRSMIFHAKADIRLWAEAANTAVHIMNRSPTKRLKNATPQEIWTGVRADLSHLRVFGCPAFAHVPKERRRKLDPKAESLIFVGYSDCSKAYRLFDPRNGSIKISRDVVFLEEKLLPQCQPVAAPAPVMWRDPQTSPVDEAGEAPITLTLDAESAGDVKPELADPEPVGLAGNDADFDPGDVDRSTCGSSEDESLEGIANLPFPERYPVRNRKPKVDPDYVSYQSMVQNDVSDPLTLSQALESPQASQWKRAIQFEIESMNKNNAWILVDPPANQKIVDCKWVFKTKRDSSGRIARYRARLVARGFTQTYGVDYLETFAPVVKFSSLRLLFALAVELDLNIDCLDVDTAFLYGVLDEVVYMRQPEGCKIAGKESKVCKLNKAIYGLKQSSRLWFFKAKEVLDQCGFTQSCFEPCVFFKCNKSKLIIVALYVDDYCIFYNDNEGAKHLKREMGRNFSVKDLGPIKEFLGWNVSRNRNKGVLKIDQSNYIGNLLEKFGMVDAKTVSSPLDPGTRLSVEGELANVPFQQLVGSLMYLSVSTRPDISFAVTYLSQFNKNPSVESWSAAKRVLKYLKGTSSLGLSYVKGGGKLTGFADADWANDPNDRRSFTGFVFKMSGAAISWECRKQKCIALSSTEAEYVAISESCKEGIYLKSFLSEIKKDVGVEKLIVFNDNQSSHKIAKNPEFSRRSKHIDVKYHHVRNLINEKQLSLVYLPTSEMCADICTKPLAGIKNKNCCSGLGLK